MLSHHLVMCSSILGELFAQCLTQFYQGVNSITLYQFTSYGTIAYTFLKGLFQVTGCKILFCPKKVVNRGFSLFELLIFRCMLALEQPLIVLVGFLVLRRKPNHLRLNQTTKIYQYFMFTIQFNCYGTIAYIDGSCAVVV